MTMIAAAHLRVGDVLLRSDGISTAVLDAAPRVTHPESRMFIRVGNRNSRQHLPASLEAHLTGGIYVWANDLLVEVTNR